MCEHHPHSMIPYVLGKRQHGAEAGFGMARGRSLCCTQHLLAQRGTVCCYTPSDLALPALPAHPAGFADRTLQDKLRQQGWCSRFGCFWLCSGVRPSHRGHTWETEDLHDHGCSLGKAASTPWQKCSILMLRASPGELLKHVGFNVRFIPLPCTSSKPPRKMFPIYMLLVREARNQ